MLTATLIYLTASMPLPIRDCDTDSDCLAAARAIGCREYNNPKRPKVHFVCHKGRYLEALANY